MRFVRLSNVMSHSQAEAYSLALSRASGNIEPYNVSKKFSFIVCNHYTGRTLQEMQFSS